MAFPSVRSQNTTNGTTATTTPTLNMPATVSAGDTLLVLFRSAVAGAISWPDGTWNELVDASPDGSDDQVGVAYKRAVGTEGGTTIQLTTGSGKFGAIIVAVQAAIDPNVRAPELSTVATGTSPNEPNATTCTPTGGAKDYLWLTWYSMEGEQTGITSYPANFTGNQSGLVNSGTGGATSTNVTMASATQPLNAASLDAGAWDVTGTLINWSAYTFAFHPLIPWPYLSFYPDAIRQVDLRAFGGMTPSCYKVPNVLVG